MPFRSRASLASGTGSSTKQEEKGNDDSGRDLDRAFEKYELASSSKLANGRTLSGSILPPPVTHNPSISSAPQKTKKNARISGGIRVHWERFRRKLGNGTAPSTSSNLDDSTAGESSGYNRSGNGHGMPEDPDEAVDEVVVDREWTNEIKSSSTHSEHGGSPEKSGGSNHLGGTNTDHESLAIHVDGFWSWHPLLIFLRWRLWPMTYSFFSTRFMDEKSEAHYNKENWFLRKSLAIWSSAFLIANWCLAIGFIPNPTTLPDKIFYYGIAPAFTFPIITMVMFDWPRDRPYIYQPILCFAIWQWGIYNMIFIYLCGKFGSPSRVDCGTKDFLTLFYYTSALQTIALFGLKLHRFAAMLGAIVFFCLACIFVLPFKVSFIRNIVNFLFFQGFLLYVHYMRENAERRLYTLRDQLKVQFRATQKAQVNERKAADSKRRLTSYVRVPLNTALLAVQNMEASGTIAKTQEIEFKALEGSLSMMSKVLNDVLDFNRMDSGRFESVLKPYAFHQVMRSLFVPLKLATDARHLEFITDLDLKIDAVARRALYESLGHSPEGVAKRLADEPNEDGIVVGDETRLRQIITNLASNACKFTPAGGKLVISTRLVLPYLPKSETMEVEDQSPDLPNATGGENGEAKCEGEGPERLSANRLAQHNGIHNKPAPLEWIVVRIEVTDTGYGIRPKDMIQSKLFSAFNQTEQGRQQGGKGTGLGLALVRQIVKLSGGRLGVCSKVHEGSTFWVELPLGVGNKAIPGLSTMHSSTDYDIRPSNVQRSHTDTTVASSVEAQRSQASASAQTVASRSSSALHSIMEQGGLVELSMRRGDPSTILTRTIGDPSTGTDPTSSSPKEEASPTPSPARSLPPEQSTETIKPHHLTLPKPPRFSIDDPITDVSPSGSASTSGTGAVGTPAPMKVLVVDDDPLTRKLMSRMLTRLGCRVSTAENGEVALDMILNGMSRATPSSEDTGCGGLVDVPPHSGGSPDDPKYGVVFLDNQMPVLSGLGAVAKLRSMGRKDFVVGVTGNALLADQQEYMDAGVDHVLTKPVYEKSLKSMLAIAADRRKRGTPTSERVEPLSPPP